MANSIYLGGGIKSAFCGGNVKEIWQGVNKLWGGEVDPMPEGFEKMDFLEFIGSSNDDVFYSSSGTNKFKNVFSTLDLIECECDYINSATSPCDFEIVGIYLNGVISHTPSPSGAKGRGLFARYRSTRGGDIDPYFTQNWDGNIARFKFYSTTDYKLITEWNGQTFKSSYSLYNTYGATGNSLYAICSVSNKALAGSRFRYWRMKDRTTGEYKINLVSARRKIDNRPAIIETISQEIFLASASKWVAGNDA